MLEKNNAGPDAGNQSGMREEHIDAERQSRGNNPVRQSDSSSNQQSDAAPDALVQSECQPTPVQQPDTRLNESHEAGSLSAAEVQGGIPGQHASAGRQSDKNDQNDTRR